MLTPLVNQTALLWPMLAHMGWVVALYAWLTVARTRAVTAGTVPYAAFEFAGQEPPAVARITRNLTNQFEAPVLFYAAVLALLHLGAAAPLDLLFGWVFVAGRVGHSVVQIKSSDVVLRGRVFTINFLAVIGLLLHLVYVIA